MHPLTDVFQLHVLEYDPELEEEKKAVFGKYVGITMKTFLFIWLMRKNSREQNLVRAAN